jgi:hypothetical protein
MMMRFAAKFSTMLAAIAMIAAPVMAQNQPPAEAPEPIVDLAAQHTATLIAGGEWTFTAPRGAPKGSPVCTESWTFRADGTMTVLSGGQTVQQTWRVANDQGFQRLFTTALSSTDGIDCMGVRANPSEYPMTEGGGAALLFFKGGQSGLLCSPVLLEMPDGTYAPYYGDEECWGELRVTEIMVPANRIDPAALPKTETTEHLMISK